MALKIDYLLRFPEGEYFPDGSVFQVFDATGWAFQFGLKRAPARSDRQ
jgi:hypothetical protein